MTTKEVNNDSKVDLGDRVKGEIELPKLDLSKYVGKKVEVESVEEHESEYGYYIKVSTKVVDTLKDMKDKDGKPIQLRASKVFGLQTDAEGNLGWGKDTALGLYLAKYKVKHYKELVGKQVLVQTITSKKDGRDYLTIN